MLVAPRQKLLWCTRTNCLRLIIIDPMLSICILLILNNNISYILKEKYCHLMCSHYVSHVAASQRFELLSQTLHKLFTLYIILLFQYKLTCMIPRIIQKFYIKSQFAKKSLMYKPILFLLNLYFNDYIFHVLF